MIYYCKYGSCSKDKNDNIPNYRIIENSTKLEIDKTA